MFYARGAPSYQVLGKVVGRSIFFDGETCSIAVKVGNFLCIQLSRARLG